jgi:hypothetical protein
MSSLGRRREGFTIHTGWFLPSLGTFQLKHVSRSSQTRAGFLEESPLILSDAQTLALHYTKDPSEGRRERPRVIDAGTLPSRELAHKRLSRTQPHSLRIVRSFRYKKSFVGNWSDETPTEPRRDEAACHAHLEKLTISQSQKVSSNVANGHRCTACG